MRYLIWIVILIILAYAANNTQQVYGPERIYDEEPDYIIEEPKVEVITHPKDTTPYKGNYVDID